MNYDNRKFKIISSSQNGELACDMIFHYQQEGRVLYCKYHQDDEISGQLIGSVYEDGTIDFRYQQVGKDKILKMGQCRSQPEILENGKIRLHEDWQWITGDKSKGNSVLEEI